MIDNVAVAAEKSELRAHLSAVRKSISKEEKLLLDRTLVDLASRLPEFIDSDTLLCYYPIKSEPNILPLAELALSLGKAVAFPISHREGATLTFHQIRDLSALRSGEYGIPEPDASLATPKDLSRAVCIVPALSVDKFGKRLGYGGGYYDRFLENFEGTSLCLIYSALCVDRLPTDEHDISVDMIITEKGGVYVNEKKE